MAGHGPVICTHCLLYDGLLRPWHDHGSAGPTGCRHPREDAPREPTYWDLLSLPVRLAALRASQEGRPW